MRLTTKSVFKKLRRGMKITDTWYGNGVVVKMMKTRAVIKLYAKSEIWTYDKQHVNHFIKIQ